MMGRLVGFIVRCGVLDSVGLVVSMLCMVVISVVGLCFMCWCMICCVMLSVSCVSLDVRLCLMVDMVLWNDVVSVVSCVVCLWVLVWLVLKFCLWFCLKLVW